MKHCIITLLSIFALTFGVQAQDGAQGAAMADLTVGQLVESADSAYSRKDYERAMSDFQAVADREGVSANLLYDLGNASFQAGDYGKAMVSWLRARRLKPNDKELNANINYLRSRVEDANKAEQKGRRVQVVADKPAFFQSLHSSIASDTSSNRWAVWGVVCFLLFMCSAAIYIFSRNVLARKAGFFGGIAVGALAVIFVIFAFMSASESHRTDIGVLTGFKVQLLTEPGKESAKAPVLTKGTEVRIVSEEADAEGVVKWYKVRLNSDFIGWVHAEDLEIV